MKIRTLLFNAILLSLVFGITSCSDEDSKISDLTVSTNYLFMKVSPSEMDETIRYVSITSGNGGYEITGDESGRSLADVEIKDDQIAFSTKNMKGKGKFLLKDKLGKQVEIELIVDGHYFLLEINGAYSEVKARNAVTESALKEEILKDVPFLSGSVLELEKSEESNTFYVYKNMKKATAGEYISIGKFEFGKDAPVLTLEQKGVVQKFELGGTVSIVFYRYFGFEANFLNKGKSKGPSLRDVGPVYESLFYDLTSKYQKKYPEAEIESARIRILARPHLYKFMPTE